MLHNLNERLTRHNIDPVYQMDELDEVLKNKTPREIILMTKDNFNINHPYFEFDGYGNLVSYSTLEEILELHEDVE